MEEYKKTSLLGVIVIIVVFVFLGGWAVFAKMDLSIKAPGEIIVKTYPKNVEHTKGGKIEQIYVKDGDFVTKNQILITLDTKQLYAKLNSATLEYHHLLASKNRIKAELENKEIIFDKDIEDNIKKNEIKLYKNRTANLKKEIKDLNYQITSNKKDIESLKKSLTIKKEILNSYIDELDNWQNLYNKGLTDKTKILDLQRKINQINNDILEINNKITQKNSEIKELQNKIELTKTKNKKELFTKLKDINSKIPSLISTIKITKNEINNSKIVSPTNGIVQNIQVHSAKEIIAPFKQIMQIIPKSDELLIEAKIAPTDIEKVKIKEKAEINFASYVDPSAIPIEGEVIYVSADIIKDPRDPKIQYYKALIKITKNGMKAIKQNKFIIIPGMPVTVFIKAGKRTFISYILYPIKQLLKGAFYAN